MQRTYYTCDSSHSCELKLFYLLDSCACNGHFTGGFSLNQLLLCEKLDFQYIILRESHVAACLRNPNNDPLFPIVL